MSTKVDAASGPVHCASDPTSVYVVPALALAPTVPYYDRFFARLGAFVG